MIIERMAGFLVNVEIPGRRWSVPVETIRQWRPKGSYTLCDGTRPSGYDLLRCFRFDVPWNDTLGQFVTLEPIHRLGGEIATRIMPILLNEMTDSTELLVWLTPGVDSKYVYVVSWRGPGDRQPYPLVPDRIVPSGSPHPVPA